jgi:hypothetical protein
MLIVTEKERHKDNNHEVRFENSAVGKLFITYTAKKTVRAIRTRKPISTDNKAVIRKLITIIIQLNSCLFTS